MLDCKGFLIGRIKILLLINFMKYKENNWLLWYFKVDKSVFWVNKLDVDFKENYGNIYSMELRYGILWLDRCGFDFWFYNFMVMFLWKFITFFKFCLFYV